MLDLECIFCHQQSLIMRQIDSKVYQVVCVGCGGAGPFGECQHEALNHYKDFIKVTHIKPH